MLRVELHCHTEASKDGLITPDGLLKAAELQRLDAIAITDHDTMDGAVEFQRWFRAKNAPTEILLGEERTLANGCHVIGLFLSQPLQGMTLPEVAREVRHQNGLLLAPHPFRAKDGLLSGKEDAALVTAVVAGWEIHNAKSSHADNTTARDYALANGHAVFGGSDAHYEADVGTCVNEIDGKGSAETAVRAMLRREIPFSIRARSQNNGTCERRYAPGYYAVKRFLPLPPFFLPAAKQLYRRYWNLKHGTRRHTLEEWMRHPAAT